MSIATRSDAITSRDSSAGFCNISQKAFAQEAAQNPVVTVDLERLVSETQIGQYLSFQMSEEAQRLQGELVRLRRSCRQKKTT